MSKQSQPPTPKLLPAPRVLPHNHRLFSTFTTTLVVAKKITLWLALIVLVFINGFLISPRLGIHLSVLPTASHINTPVLKKFMTEISLLFSNANKELAQNSSSVLGASTQTADPSRITYDAMLQEYAYWQSAISTHPEYRDGYVQLAILAYELKKYTEANMYITKISAIDPNYPLLPKLQGLLPRE